MEKFEYIKIDYKNKKEYLPQIIKLENDVEKSFSNEGKQEQFFTSGEKEINHNIDEELVIGCINHEKELKACAYFTKSTQPYQYSDLTKYFKADKKYLENIKESYSDEKIFLKDMLDAYEIKIKAFKYAKEQVLGLETPIKEIIESEKIKDGFNEKNKLREEIHDKMNKYVKNLGAEELYNKFYLVNKEMIYTKLDKNVKLCEIVGIRDDYDEFLAASKLKIHKKNTDVSREKRYYGAKLENTLNIDTYMVSSDVKGNGIAKKMMYHGLELYITKYFEGDVEKLYLTVTVHNENKLSKNVLDFFELKDSILVERRLKVDRLVKIARIDREDSKAYLERMKQKIQNKEQER